MLVEGLRFGLRAQLSDLGVPDLGSRTGLD